MNANVKKNEELFSSLPSPPSSPIDYEPSQQQQQQQSRKRAFSLSFIQNEEEPTIVKKQKFDLGCLKTFLKSNGSPNTCDKQFNRSLLSWACLGQSKEAIEDLTSLVHLDINQKSGPHQSTALHEACMKGYKEGIQLLVQHADIDMNALDKMGQTALHCATQGNKLECIDILLSAGARMDIMNKQGRLPIHIAIAHGYTQCVSLFLSACTKHENNPSQLDMIWTRNLVDNKSSIESAIVAGYISTVHILLDHDQKIEKRNALVQLSVEWNRIECLQLLIKRGYTLEQKNILTAVQQRKIDLVRELSLAGVDPCLANRQNPSLLYAANHGFLDMVPLILSLNTSKDCVQQALQLASCIGLRDQLANVVVRTLKQKVVTSSPSK